MLLQKHHIHLLSYSYQLDGISFSISLLVDHFSTHSSSQRLLSLRFSLSYNDIRFIVLKKKH